MIRGIGISVCLGGLALATDCAASTHQNQIEPTDHGTFVIPSGLMGTSSSSIDKARAVDDATAYCMKHGKEIKTILTSENGSGFLEMAAPLIEIRCVPPAASG
jgi:hypothetical protein